MIGLKYLKGNDIFFGIEVIPGFADEFIECFRHKKRKNLHIGSSNRLLKLCFDLIVS